MKGINQVTIVGSVESKLVQFDSDERRGGQACSYIIAIRRAKNLANAGCSAAGAKSSDMKSMAWISADKIRTDKFLEQRLLMNLGPVIEFHATLLTSNTMRN